MPLKLNSTGGGSVTVDVPNTASTFTATLPAKTGTLITSADTGTVTQAMLASNIAGNGPAFSAYRSTTQNVTNATWTKVALNAEYFDTANCFDSTTNYRFTPNVEGYYQINGSIYPVSTNSAGYIWIILRKNGSDFVYGSSAGSASTADGVSIISTLMYLNGSTDYIEMWCYLTGTSPTIPNNYTQLNGFLARAA